MKRAIIQWILLLAALPMTAMGAAAQQAESAAPPAQTGAKPRDEKNGTGIVPQGVKLEPGMPAPAAPKKYEFPRSATKTRSYSVTIGVQFSVTSTPPHTPTTSRLWASWRWSCPASA